MTHMSKKKIDLVSVEWANGRQLNRIDHALKLVEKINTDPHRKERLKESECLLCYKESRVSCAACSDRPCGICEKRLTAGNTDVDVLCLECAKKSKLCKHCGADIDYKNRRKREI